MQVPANAFPNNELPYGQLEHVLPARCNLTTCHYYNTTANVRFRLCVGLLYRHNEGVLAVSS